MKNFNENDHTKKLNSKPFKMTHNSNRLGILIFLYQLVFIRIIISR